MQWWHRLTPRGRIVVLAGTLVAAFGAAFALRDIFWLGAFAIAVVLGAASGIGLLVAFYRPPAPTGTDA